ncbi:hypothetical protein [Novosphingobium sp.]|uniref:hypothetical protein n=1 Tax=Novosphingobium sp. TaxID=1874826 RepID=UPI0025CCCB8E|nr:hypothetical protein [Novosphingobium sp.]
MTARLVTVRQVWLALAAAMATLAQPAGAQITKSAQSTTGTVNLTGSVASRCGVAASGSGTSLDQTVALGELAAANGTLRSGIEGQFANAVAAISVVCNTAAPTVSISASPLSAQTNTGTPPAGFANAVAFTATVSFLTTASAPVVLSTASGSSASHTLSAGEGRIANSPGNVVLTASAFHTAGAADILVADASYKGSIAVTIAPGA